MSLPKIIRADSYNIHIGEDAFRELDIFLKTHYSRTKKIILADENTRKFCLPVLINNTDSLADAEILEIESGEEHKSIRTCEYCWDALNRSGADRRSVLILLGGGVIGDVGGFVAATYLRGIDFILVPTTLLSMVDASVGGKNGINYSGIKNQVGTFTRPNGVFIAPVFLNALPEREIKSGFAEVIKHALISGGSAWYDLLQLASLENINWGTLICESVVIKNSIVLSDFRDRAKRKWLNFGHTVGHALESYSLAHDTDPLKHGEAVAAGLIAEIYLSVHLLAFPLQDAEVAYRLIRKYFGYRHFSGNGNDLLHLVRADKKNEFSEYNFVLLRHLGRPVINQHPAESLIAESVDFALNYINQPVAQI